MSRVFTVALLLVLGGILAFAMFGDRNPEPLEGSVTAERIVSLAPSLTEITLRLDEGHRLVGVSAYCEGVGDGIPRVGTLLAPNLEAIVDLEPDRVLGIVSAAQASVFQTLEERGIRVERFGGDDIAGVRDALSRLGDLYGRGDEAGALVSRLDRALAFERDPQGPRVLFVVNRGPLFCAGGGSFVHEMIEAAGGRNVLAGLDEDWPRVDLERLLVNPPDVIVDNTLGDGRDAEVLAAWRAVAPRLAAVEKGRVRSFPSVRAGVQIPDWIELLRSRIH